MKSKILIVLVLLAGCAEEKKDVMYQSGPYICEEWNGSRMLSHCVNMSDMSEIKKIYNPSNIIEIEVGK